MRAVIKQYGEKRTATNYLRKLLNENVEVIVADNLLGWKHGFPEDLLAWRAYLEDPQANDKPMSPDYANGDIITVETEYRWRRKCMREKKKEGFERPNHFDSCIHHIDNRSLLYTVSIRDPFAWLIAAADYDFEWDAENLWLLERLIQRFNLRYRAWRSYLATKVGYERFVRVRHEDLLVNPVKVVGELIDHFGLTLRDGVKQVEDVTKEVLSSGKTGEAYEKRAHNREYYLERQYMSRYTPESLALAERCFDWSMLDWYGYTVEGPK